MTERKAMLRPILLDPGSDKLRLVYADWLDDRGEEERAEFVRLGVELARWRADDAERSLSKAGMKFHSGLRARLDQLWPDLREQYRSSVGSKWAVHADPIIPMVEASGPAAAIVRRGFVDEIRLPLRAFAGGSCERCDGEPVCEICDGTNQVDHPNGGCNLCPNGFDYQADRQVGCRPKCEDCHGTGSVPGVAQPLFESHPITRVVLTCREPVGSVSGWWWSSRLAAGTYPESILPDEIFRLLPWVRPESVLSPSYPTAADALAALSAACVAWARELAGLDPLPPARPGIVPVALGAA